MSATKKATGRPAADDGGAFTAEERAAMKERAAEVKAERARARGGKGGAGAGDGAKAEPDAEVLAKIAELPEPDRVLAERVHAIVRDAAPGLEPRTWYGMPAYAVPGKGRKPGPIVCFLQPASKFGARYATLGFEGAARLDDGAMWPTAFAVTELTDTVEKRIRELLARAVEPAG